MAEAVQRAQDKQHAAIKQGLSWPAMAAEQRAIGLLDMAVVKSLPFQLACDPLPSLLEEAELPALAVLARARLGATLPTTSAMHMHMHRHTGASAQTACQWGQLGPDDLDIARSNALLAVGGVLTWQSAIAVIMGHRDLLNNPRMNTIACALGLSERGRHWDEYAAMCEKAFGTDDERTKGAKMSAREHNAAVQLQLAKSTTSETELVRHQRCFALLLE